MRNRQRHGTDLANSTRSLRALGSMALKGAELTAAATTVIAKRTALAAAGAVDPLGADHAEFARMIPEKAHAFSAAGAIMLQGSGQIARQAASYAATEMEAALKAGSAAASCRTPGELLALQGRFAMGCMERAWSQSLAVFALGTRVQGLALGPVHRAATANERRLR